MELGNAVFGNSRGEISIDRDEFQDLFCNLMERYRLFNEDDYPETQVNDMFEVRPYYWGDCTCDYDKASEKWSEENDHQPNCYWVELRDFENEFVEKRKNAHKDDNGINHINIERPSLEDVKHLLEKHNLPEQGWGMHCDCDHDDRWQQFLKDRGGGHTSECECEKPNFWYKPDDFRIDWYKYPLRDSYSNKKFTKEYLKEIFKKIGEYQKSLKS